MSAFRDVHRSRYAALRSLPQKQAFLRELERTLHREAQAAVEAALQETLHSLRHAGWSFAQDPGALPFTLVDTLDPSAHVRVSTVWMGTTQASLHAPPPPLSETDARRKVTQDRFYAAADEAFATLQNQPAAKLSTEAQDAYLLRNLEAEVNNGGFEQFFDNSTGDRTSATLESLQRVGAQKTAALLEQALVIFPDGLLRRRGPRQRKLVALKKTHDHPFSKQDAAFHRSPEDLALRWAQHHTPPGPPVRARRPR